MVAVTPTPRLLILSRSPVRVFSPVERTISFVTPLKVSWTAQVVDTAPELDAAKPDDVAEAERARDVMSVIL